MFPRVRPNINWVRAAVCPAVVFIATAMDRGYQTDFWHHLARGREIAETGRPAGAGVDAFTFTVAGQPVRDANWLTQLAYFRLFELGGLPLVQTLNSLVLAVAAALLVWVCRRRGATMAVAAAVGVCAFAGAWQTLLIRPQSVSLLLFMALFAILVEAEARRLLLLVVPPLFALWANVHGGFPIGLVLIAAFILANLAERVATPLRRRMFVTVARDKVDGGIAVPAMRGEGVFADERPPVSKFAVMFGLPGRGDARDRALVVRGGAGMLPLLIVCLITSAAATLLNPYGIGIYDYVFSLSARASGREVEEWLPPSMGLWVGRAFAASVVALIAVLALAPRRPRARDVFVALCFLPLAAASVRMVPWWLLAVAPVLAAAISRNLVPKTSSAGLTGRHMPFGRPAALGNLGSSWRSSPFVAAAMLGFIALAVTMSVPAAERVNPVYGIVRSPNRLEAQIQAVLDDVAPSQVDGGHARVFARLEWGEYLVWAAHPRWRVFMDGRIEIYPDDVWRQYHAVTDAGAEWQTILDDRGVDLLLLDSTYHARLLTRVAASSRWDRLSQSGPAILYRRRASNPAPPDPTRVADSSDTP